MTNSNKFNDFRQQLTGILNAIRVYETRAPTPQELEAERDTFLEDMAITRRWFDFFRNDPPDAQQKNELSAEINALVPALGGLAQHAGAQGHSLERVLANFIANLRQIEAIPATGAGGAGTQAVQQAARMLENLDSIITKQAEQVAQEIKEELSEEARALTLEHAAWIKVAAVIGKLQTINADLITAEQHKDSSVATASLKTALGMLSILGIDLTSIETHIRSALSMNKRAETVAKKAADQLKAIQGQLNIEAARINQARFNNLVT